MSGETMPVITMLDEIFVSAANAGAKKILLPESSRNHYLLLSDKLKKEIAVETRGMGLMRGLELSVPAGPYITKALEKGVIFMSAGANVIRFIPPLIIEKSDVDKMIAILDSVLDD